jgi:hypothetical protein
MTRVQSEQPEVNVFPIEARQLFRAIPDHFGNRVLIRELRFFFPDIATVQHFSSASNRIWIRELVLHLDQVCVRPIVD